VRPGGEKRGNNRDRARRRDWIMGEHDPELGPLFVRCALQIADNCVPLLTHLTLTIDRLDPGGTYARYNIQPACRWCQHLQGALITKARRIDWKRWREEADDKGIEWDGQIA
jgi:hypothetical protein